MHTQKTVTIGYYLSKNLASTIFRNSTDLYGTFMRYLSETTDTGGKLILAFKQYLEQTKKFDRISYIVFDERDTFFPDGTFRGTNEKINYSEIDIFFPPYLMLDYATEMADFTYPIKQYDWTFVTRKPEYIPQTFGIFRTFSLPVWITMALIFIAMLLIHYTILKHKFNFSKILFHVFAVLMRQESGLETSSLAGKILVYSWVFGCMILCLSYDSVFLSFLSIPPITKIKDLTDLASAVQKGECKCIADYKGGIVEVLRNSNQGSLKVIVDDILRNAASYGFVESEFIIDAKYYRNSKNYVLFIITDKIDIYRGKFFISEDRVSGTFSGLMFRKNFCCKELLNIFIHRIVASGIFFKMGRDLDFLFSLKMLPQKQIDDDANRKLTLTDVAPAFIFLLSGYIISLLVLIGEILYYTKNLNQSTKRKKRKGKVAF